MSPRTRKKLEIASVVIHVLVLLPMLVGFVFFPRPDLPPLVREDTCTRYGIRFDTASIEKIYSDPQGILADPQKFLGEDRAYRLFASHRQNLSDPLEVEAWLGRIKKLTSPLAARREAQLPFRLYRLIIENRNAFCREVAATVLSYLPEISSTGVTIYLTTLEGSAPAFSAGREIAFSLSHPLFAAAQLIHEPTGLSAFYNLALHELFHVYSAQVFKEISLEEHKADEVVIDMLLWFRKEGMGTYISHQLSARYPSPFEWFLYAVDQEPVVRPYVRRMNDLFAIARTKPTGEAYDDVYRRLVSLGNHRKGFYIVGAYMAMTIEAELGREALAQALSGDYRVFAETYNAVADDDIKLRWSDAP